MILGTEAEHDKRAPRYNYYAMSVISSTTLSGLLLLIVDVQCFDDRTHTERWLGLSSVRHQARSSNKFHPASTIVELPQEMVTCNYITQMPDEFLSQYY